MPKPEKVTELQAPPHTLNLLRVKLEAVAAEMLKGNIVQAYELLRQTQEFVNYELAKK